MSRPVQPKCDECNHTLSFHKDKKSCKALVCKCPKWKPPKKEK